MHHIAGELFNSPAGKNDFHPLHFSLSVLCNKNIGL
jgi:hypothetical protein